MRKQHAFVVGILLFASTVFAQHPAMGGHKPMEMPAGQMESMDCEAMMQKMQASSKAMDDRLQTLVDQMNSANGTAKVDQTAAVINELVSQRKQMREQMMSMMPQMMGHMMQHMQSDMKSGKSGMSKSMASCPMMKGSTQATPPSGAEHKH